MIGTITPQFVLIFIILRVCCLFFYMRKINFVDDMRQVESCLKVFLQDYWFCTCNILGFLHFYSDSVTTRVPSLTSEKISSNFIQPLQLSVSNWRKLSHMKSLIFSIAIYWSLELIFYLHDRRALVKPTWDCTTESVQISTQIFRSLKRQLLVWKPCLSHNPIRPKWDTKGSLW